MKKKSVIYLVILTLVVLALTAGYLYYQKTISSPQLPSIYFDESVLFVTTDATDEELLAGVTAEDPEDGDVTDSVLVESVSNIISGNYARVTYVAFDSQNHMCRAQRTVRYSDYMPPQFSLTHPMIFRLSSTLNILDYIEAEDMFDGDISRKVIYNLMGTSTTFAIQGEHPVEIRVTNSKGDTAHLDVTVEITDREPNPANIQLKEYLVYVPVGSEFNPADYFKSFVSGSAIVTNMSGITVESDVDTQKAGTYTVTYSHGAGESGSHTRLVVVVE